MCYYNYNEKLLMKDGLSMAVVIGILNRKGGSGKTTTVFNLAGILARNYKYRVLVIDTDSQGNLTQRLLSKSLSENRNFLESRLTLEDLFQNPKDVNKAVYTGEIVIKGSNRTIKRGVDIIPNNSWNVNSKGITLADVDDFLHIEEMETKEMNFPYVKEMIKHIRKTREHLYHYDFIFIDFPPSLSRVSYNCLGACDYVLAPATLGANSIDGLDTLLDTIRMVKESGLNPSLQFLGMFCTDVVKVEDLPMQMLGILRSQVENFISIPIRHDTNVGWSLTSNIPLAWYKRRGNATRDYILLAQYILKHLGMLDEISQKEYDKGMQEIKGRYQFD